MPLIKHIPKTEEKPLTGAVGTVEMPPVTVLPMSSPLVVTTNCAVLPAITPPELPKPVYIGRKKAETDDDKMSKADWAAKDRRIGRAGLYQAALQSVGVNQYATGRTLDEYLKVVRQAAEDGLRFVNEAAE